MAIALAYVIDEVSYGHVIEAFIRVIEFNVIDGFNGICHKLDRDVLDVLKSGLSMLGFFIVSTEVFALVSGSSWG